MRDVFVAGAGMTKFGKYAPGSGIRLAKEASTAALADAGVDFTDLDAFIAGTGNPATPRGVYLAKQLGVTGLAVSHVEHASATGLSAMHSAWLSVGSGEFDAVLVLGVECPDRELSTLELIEGEGNLPAPALFAMWANRRMHDNGTTPEHLAMVAAKNWNYARQNNPYAARIAQEPVTVEQILASKVVAPPYTSKMCTPWGDGAAAALVCSADWLDKHDTGSARVKMLSSHIESETYNPGHIFAGSIVGPPEMSRKAAEASYERSGKRPEDVDVVLVHDAFAVEELVYYELLGFAGPGQSESLLEQGAFGPGSREKFGLPEFSTHGGLIAGGHPGGPTGVAQIWETVRQLRDNDKQVSMCHMLGAGSVAITQMFERADA